MLPARLPTSKAAFSDNASPVLVRTPPRVPLVAATSSIKKNTMSDFLLELGQNHRARALIKGLGLPIPMPQELARAGDAFAARPLDSAKVG